MCKQEWNTHLCMPLVVHDIIDHVLRHPRGVREWDTCLHLRIWIVEYRGSENVTPAEERESRSTGRKEDGRFRT